MPGAGDGVHTAGPQVVPPEARAQTAVIVGNTGSGKSSAGRAGFVEPILEAKRRCCIIDPTGIWWGLRFMADGSPGFPVAIVGGLYGDAPLSEVDAVPLADWIGSHDQPVIVDVSEMTIGERQEFAGEFFAQLYKSNRRPLHLIIDEADEFAPQNPMPETRRLLHHVDRIVRRGRVRGFRPLMITQRPSVLHKNVMSQASALLAMRLLGSQDRDAVQMWIKGQGDMAAGKEVLNTLARLQVGEGWQWAPGLGILNRGRFPMFKTFDSSRTPKDDEPPVDPPGPFPWADKFSELLAGVTDADAAVPGIAITTQPDPTKLAAAERAGWEDGHRKGFEKGYVAASAALLGRVEGVLHAGADFMERLREIARDLAAPKPNEGPPIVSMHVSENAQPATRVALLEVAKAASTSAPLKRAQTAIGLSGAAQKLLAALASVDHPVTWQGACVIAGLISNNGYFYGGRKYLLAEGYIEEHSGLVEVTKAGRKVIGGPLPAVTRKALLEQWAAKLKAPGGQMLLAIAGTRTLQMRKVELAAKLNLKPDNGYWYGGIAAMRTAGLIDQEGDAYRLTPTLKDAQ